MSPEKNNSSRIERAIMNTIQKFNLKDNLKEKETGFDSEFRTGNRMDSVNINSKKNILNSGSGFFNTSTDTDNSKGIWQSTGILANLNTQKSQKFIETFFTDVINILNVDVSVNVRFTGTSFIVSLIGNDANVFIGTHGSVLYAYQHIINLLLKKYDSPKVFLNASNYREERKESLSRYAISCAKKVLRTRIKFVFEPMNSYDRLVIHEALRNFSGVVTHTEGSEDAKYVSIELESSKKN